MQERFRMPIIVAVIVGLAAFSAFGTGGGKATSSIADLLGAIFLGAVVIASVKIYRETRSRLELSEIPLLVAIFSVPALLILAFAWKADLRASSIGTGIFLLMLAAAIFLAWRSWNLFKS